MTEPMETLLEPSEAEGFFPKNLASMLGLPSKDVRFFGTYREEKNSTNNLRTARYLVSYISRSALPDECKNLSLIMTDDDRIRCEAIGYNKEVSLKYPVLEATVPLLIIRIRSYWFQHKDNPNKVVELHRYADHNRFRKRGLASAVLESVCQKMRTKGTEYLYVNFPWERWPKSSKITPTLSAPNELRTRISDCLPQNSG